MSGKNFYICKCKIGWSGDGKVCGPDRDLDGWPDFDLPCQVPHAGWSAYFSLVSRLGYGQVVKNWLLG